MGDPNGDGAIESSEDSIAPSKIVKEHPRLNRWGKPITVEAYARGTRDDDWLKASALRRIMHLLAAFHQDVAKEVPEGEITREAFLAWWGVVEERDWRELADDIDWVLAFFHPIRAWLGYRRTKPPMVKALEEMASERLAFYEPSLAFRRYQLMRPDVYQHFKRLAEELLNAGHTAYSAEQLLVDVRTVAGIKHSGDRFSAEYARKLVAEDARFAKFFLLRAIRRRAN